MINETQAKEFALGIEDPAIPDMQKFKMATALDEYFKAEDLKIDKGVKKAFTTDTVEGVEINDDIMAGFGAAPEDIANIKKGAANTAWIARQEKKPVDYFSLTLPAYQDAYAQQVFKLPKKNVTNDEFYNLVRENYKAQDNAHNFAFGAAARDLTADSAMREFDVGLTGSPVAGRIDDYHQSIQDLHMEYTQKLAPYRTIIDQAAKTIEGYDTKAEGAYTAFEKVAESLLPLPPKERLLAINAIGEIGAAAPKEKRVYLEKIMLAMDREIEKAKTGTANMVESMAYSGLEAGLSAMNLPGLAKATSGLATKRRDLQVLAGQIRMMAQNKINPIEGNNWWEDTGIGIARMAPLMTATFINGPASIAIMTGQFRDEATIEAVNAGASLENSEIVAFFAAPIMAGQEFLSNALPLGKIKIPFIDKWLKASTTSIKSAAIRLAIRGSLNTGTEITEEIMQTVTPLVTQDLLSEWQTEWSIESGIAKADWDERMPKISDIAKETFGPALVISFLMAGRISIADVKNSRALMTSPDYMVASGISPDLANQITAEGLKGNYNEVDKLFRQGFDKANKATPEQIKEAEEKVNTQASNSLEYYNKLKKEFGLGTVSNLGNGKYQFTTPILRGSKGEVVDSGVSAQFNSISEANEAQMLYVKNRQASIRKAEQEFITSMNTSLQEKQGLDIALMDFDMFTKTFTELFPSTASQVDERIKLTDQIDGAAEDVSFEDATLESEVKDNKNYRILGTNSIEQREGISTGVITLYSGGSLLDLIEESAEVGVKRMMNDPMSRTKLILQIRDVEAKMKEQAMQMGQKHMPLIATADDDQVSNMEIIEAFSHIAKSYYVQTAKAVERPTFDSDMPLNLYLGSLQSSIAGMELKDAIDLVGEKTLNILYRASQIKAVYDANGMNQDFIDALEKSVGLNVSNRNADAVVDTAAGLAADSGVLPSTTMSMAIASPEDIAYNEAIRVQPTSMMERIASRDGVGVRDNILYRKDRAYRFIGEEGLADLRESGLVRARQNTKQAYEGAVFMSGKSSGRYADTHMIELIPDDTWSGDKYITPPNNLAINDIPHRIYERNANGSYSVIEDTIGDQALLNEGGVSMSMGSADEGQVSFSLSVQTVAANILADRAGMPSILDPFFVNKKFLVMEADRTAAGGQFTLDIAANGGPGFVVNPRYMGKVGWASAKPEFWLKKLNRAIRTDAIYIGKDGREKFLVSPYLMEEDAHVSNSDVVGSKLSEVARYVDEGRITDKQEQDLATLVIHAAGSLISSNAVKLKHAEDILILVKAQNEYAALKSKEEKTALLEKLVEDDKARTLDIKKSFIGVKVAPKKGNPVVDVVLDIQPLDVSLIKKKTSLDLKKAKNAIKAAKQTISEITPVLKFPTKFSGKEMTAFVTPLTFPARGFIAEKLSSATAENLGAPPMGQIQRVTRDDSYHSTPTRSLTSLIEVDVKELREGLDAKGKGMTNEAYGVPVHGSYNTFVPGKAVVFFRTPIPYSIGMPQMSAELFGKGKKVGAHTFHLKVDGGTSIDHEVITPNMATEWNNLQTVKTNAATAKTIVAALGQKWITMDRAGAAGLAEFPRAIRNSNEAVTLTAYTLEKVKSLISDGKMKVYRLGEMDAWFALKRPNNEDGDVGDPTKDWCIVGVVNNTGGAQGVLPLIMAKAIAEGGTQLDCYAVASKKKPLGLLPTLYARSGFQAVKTLAFDPQYHQEPGKMQDLMHVWETQSWDGLVEPPLVYMTYNPNAYAEITADSESTAVRTSQANESSVDGGSMQTTRADSGTSSRSMGGKGQKGTRGGVSDSASTTGNDGGFTPVLPRRNQSLSAVVTEFENALNNTSNDYTFEAWGVTREEVQEAVDNWNNPNAVSFSISRSDFTGRIEQSLRPIFEGSPEVKLKIGMMALKRAQKIAADSLYDVGRPGAAKRKLAEMEASRIKKLGKVTDKTPDWVKKSLEKETTPEQAKAALMKDKLNGWIQMHDAIVSSMPTEIRGTIGSISTLAKLSSDEARLRFIEDRMPKVEKAIEKYLKKGYGERLDKMLEAAAVKGKAGDIPKSKFIVTVQDELNTIIAMSNLSDDETVKEAARYEAEIISAQTSEDAADAFAKSQLLEIFGDLYGKQTTAEEMDVAHEYLKDLMKQGRDARKVLDEARAAEVAKMVEQAKADAFAGDANAATVQRGKDKGKGTTKGMIKGFLREHGSHRFVLSSVFGRSNKTADQFDERMILGVNAFETRQAARKKSLRDFMRSLYGTKSKISLDIELEKMETKVERSRVTKMEGEVREKDTKTVEEVERIIKSPSTFGYSAEEAQMWEDEMDAWSNLPTSRKRNLTIERIKVKGTRIEIPLSQMEAVYMAMALRQPGILDQQTVHGYDNITQAELEDFMSDKAKNWLSWFGAEYANEYDAANEVFMRLFNTRMPQIQFYAPLLKNHQGNQASLDPLNSNVVSQSANPGAVKTRRGRTSSLRIESALAVYQSHFAQMDYWINMAEYLRDTQAVMLNPEVRAAIQSEHGDEAMQAVSAWVQLEMARGVSKGALLIHSSRMMRNVKSGIALKALAFNIGTSIKTLSSVFYSLGEISITRWPAAFARGIQHWSRMWDTNIIQNRLELGGTPEIREILANRGKSKNIILRLVENALLYGSMPTQYADAVLTSYSAAMVYGDRLAQAENANVGDEAAHKYAAREMEIAVPRTAQPNNWSGRSLMQNDATGVFNLLSMFSSDPQQKLSLVGEAIMKWRRGGSTNEEVVRKVLAYWVIPGLMFQVANAVTRSMFKDDDEEWEVDNFIRAALVGPLQGLFILGAAAEFFIASAVAYAAEKITGEEQDKPRNWRSSANPLVDISEQFWKSIEKLPEKMEDEDYLGGAWEIMKAGGALSTPFSPAGAAPGVADRVFKDTTTLFYGKEED
jgi:hypothetical protein